MDLYSVTTVMKEYDGYKNASFHWFYCDARTIPRPYVDLIENYNGMNRLRAAYAEGYIDESFTLDEAQALKELPRSNFWSQRNDHDQKTQAADHEQCGGLGSACRVLRCLEAG